MRSEFLEQEQGEYQGGGLGAVAADLYGWQTRFMLAEFQKTGGYKVPFSSVLGGGGIKYSTIGKKWGVRPVANQLEALGLDRGLFNFSPIMYGTSMRPLGKLGAAQLIGSQAVRASLATMIFTDPVYFGFAALTRAVNPWMIPPLIAWYAGKAILRDTAKAMERTRYVDMNQIFPDTQAAFTSRQRAVRAISESHLQARSAIGNEAMLYHR